MQRRAGWNLRWLLSAVVASAALQGCGDSAETSADPRDASADTQRPGTGGSGTHDDSGSPDADAAANGSGGASGSSGLGGSGAAPDLDASTGATGGVGGTTGTGGGDAAPSEDASTDATGGLDGSLDGGSGSAGDGGSGGASGSGGDGGSGGASGSGGATGTVARHVHIYISNTCDVSVDPAEITVPREQSVLFTYHNHSVDYDADVWMSYGGGYLGLVPGDMWSDPIERCSELFSYTAYADVSIHGLGVNDPNCPGQRMLIHCE